MHIFYAVIYNIQRLLASKQSYRNLILLNNIYTQNTIIKLTKFFCCDIILNL